MNRFKISGRELMKGNIGNALKSFVSPMGAYDVMMGDRYYTDQIYSENYRNLNSNILSDLSNYSPDHFFCYNGQSSSIRAFKKCAPLSSILTSKASAYINGKTWVLDKKGKEVNSVPAQRIRNLLAKPNPFQTWPEFEAQAKIYRDLFGYNMILPITPHGFDNTYAKSLWNIPIQYVTFEVYNKVPWMAQSVNDLIAKIIFQTPDGLTAQIDVNAVFIQKGLFPSLDTIVIPNSPIEPLQQQINNIVGAYESRGILIHQRGALGILSQELDPNGTTPLTPDQQVELQKDFAKYGLQRHQYKFIISPLPLKWQQMGIPTRDLALFEEIKDDVEQLCDAFSYPFELLANANGSTFSNKKEASKLLYQNTIIPESIIDYAGLESFFSCEKYGLQIQKDYSHIAVLQDNKMDEARGRNMLSVSLIREFYNNLITYNRVLELLGEDTVNGMDRLYKDLLAEGWVFNNSNFLINGTAETQTGNQADNASGSQGN